METIAATATMTSAPTRSHIRLESLSAQDRRPNANR
jgi:hypothetical protein